MTRGRGLLLVTLLMLGGARHAQAQGFLNSRDIMGGGPNFFGGGASPIPRTAVMYPTNYSPGTIVISTPERRLYLVLGNGRALRYGIGVGRDGFRWGGTSHHRQEGMAELDTAVADAAPSPGPAAPHGRRCRKSARRPRDVSRLNALSHPRLE